MVGLNYLMGKWNVLAHKHVNVPIRTGRGSCWDLRHNRFRILLTELHVKKKIWGLPNPAYRGGLEPSRPGTLRRRGKGDALSQQQYAATVTGCQEATESSTVEASNPNSISGVVATNHLPVESRTGNTATRYRQPRLRPPE